MLRMLNRVQELKLHKVRENLFINRLLDYGLKRV